MTHSRDTDDGCDGGDVSDGDADDLNTPITTNAVVAAPAFANHSVLNSIKTITMMIMKMLEMMMVKC